MTPKCIKPSKDAKFFAENNTKKSDTTRTGTKSLVPSAEVKEWALRENHHKYAGSKSGKTVRPFDDDLFHRDDDLFDRDGDFLIPKDDEDD